MRDSESFVEVQVAEVRRARIGPGLRPGPCRQARWAGRGLRRSRVGPEERFCGAVRNALRVPLTLEGLARTMCGVPAPLAVTSSRFSVHSAHGDRPGQLVDAHDPRRVTAGCGAARCGASARRAAARDRCAPAQEGVGQAAPPPAARVPNTLRCPPRHFPARLRLPCLSCASFACRRPGPVGLARRRCSLDDRKESPHHIRAKRAKRTPRSRMAVPVEPCPDGADSVISIDSPVAGQGTNDVEPVPPRGVVYGWSQEPPLSSTSTQA